ncbi:MAG: imidazole glycerol phosphate synthase subunit HisH [Magnetococcales bacterium]|nr:imidazole glycerol phosphate synthase subunit HisH [Magnetococcales bacterium]
MAQVTVVDYGAGNLLSVRRAFEHFGAEVVVTGEAGQIASAERLVLPGVGAFGKGMAELRGRGLVPAILTYASEARPLLGICLGMQMLLDESVEFGSHSGLGLIPGKVVPIPAQGRDGKPHCIPHIGWNGLVHPVLGDQDWQGTVLEGIAPGSHAYFVHSFMALPDHPAHRLADCIYHGLDITGVIRKGNVTGCQFHPEKSGEIGLRIIEGFLKQ